MVRIGCCRPKGLRFQGPPAALPASKLTAIVGMSIANDTTMAVGVFGRQNMVTHPKKSERWQVVSPRTRDALVQAIRCGLAELPRPLSPWLLLSVHTENIYKFTDGAIDGPLQDSGFESESTWRDERDYGAVLSARPSLGFEPTRGGN
jgi:ligand-binding SRPBCC domain-containing protein